MCFGMHEVSLTCKKCVRVCNICVLICQNCVLSGTNFLGNERNLNHFIHIKAEVIAKGLIIFA